MAHFKRILYRAVGTIVLSTMAALSQAKDMTSGELENYVKLGVDVSTTNTGVRLINFHSSDRVAGEYYVSFKTDVNLSGTTAGNDTSESASLSALSVVERDVKSVASGLSNRTSGHLNGVLVSDTHRAFVLKDASDHEVETVLGLDSRIDYIAAAIRTTTLEVQGSNGNPAPWGLSRIAFRDLKSQGLQFPVTYTYTTLASGVRIYILDTGVRTSHQEFQGRAGNVVLDCVAGLATIGNCGLSVSSPDAQDCAGHGTAVASVAGGYTDGVAKGINIASFIVAHSSNFGQVCNSPSSTPALIAAIRWIIAKERFNWNGPQVINLSITALSVDPALENAISDAIAAGLVVVAGAPDNRTQSNGVGLDPCSGSTAVSPVDMSAIIGVGGTGLGPYQNQNFRIDRAWESWDVGSCISLFAPGVGIPVGGIAADNSYATGTGTSFAVPIVAGIAALYLQTHAHATQSEVKAGLIAGATTGQLYRGVYNCACSTNGLPYPLDSSNTIGNGAPNRLAYSLLPSGSDNAVGGVTGGSWLAPIKKIISAIFQLLFSQN
jgi:subtilisin family serine protease